MVAEARKPIRISGLMRGMLYAFAMHGTRRPPRPVGAAGGFRCPGLANPESQLGVPLLVRGELVGVLSIESDMPYRFHDEDKSTIELLGSYLAIAIQNMQLQERTTETAEAPSHAPGAARRTAAGARHATNRVAPRGRLLRGRRMHPARRRIPDPQPAGQDPLAAADRARRRRGGRSSPIASCGWTSR